MAGLCTCCLMPLPVTCLLTVSLHGMHSMILSVAPVWPVACVGSKWWVPCLHLVWPLLERPPTLTQLPSVAHLAAAWPWPGLPAWPILNSLTPACLSSETWWEKRQTIQGQCACLWLCHFSFCRQHFAARMLSIEPPCWLALWVIMMICLFDTSSAPLHIHLSKPALCIVTTISWRKPFSWPSFVWHGLSLKFSWGEANKTSQACLNLHFIAHIPFLSLAFS